LVLRVLDVGAIVEVELKRMKRVLVDVLGRVMCDEGSRSPRTKRMIVQGDYSKSEGCMRLDISLRLERAEAKIT
jgi:hypothetical protein